MNVHHCAQTGKLDRLKELVLAQPSLIHARASGRTPLYCACQAGELDMIEWLVLHGADTEARNNSGMRPIDSTPPCLRPRVQMAINEALAERLSMHSGESEDRGMPSHYEQPSSPSSSVRAGQQQVTPRRGAHPESPSEYITEYTSEFNTVFIDELGTPETLRPADVPQSPPPIVMNDFIPPPPAIGPRSPLYRAWARRNRTPVHAMALAFQHLAYVGTHSFGHPDRDQISRYFQRPQTLEDPDTGQLGDAMRSEWRRMNNGSWRRAPVLPISDEVAFERRQLWGELQTSLSRMQSRRLQTRRPSQNDLLAEIANELVDDAIIDAELESLLREQEERFENVRREVQSIQLEVPDEYTCPIGMDIMLDPVVCADGFSYERTNIAKWLIHNVRSPRTNLPLEWRQVIPNRNLKAAIDSFLERHAVKSQPLGQIFP